MAALSPLLRSVENGGLAFHCPGCDSVHIVWVGAGQGPRWGWNGSVDRPTFTPSILVTYDHWVPPAPTDEPQTKVRDICHSYVTDGRIQFLPDSTHSLAGQTVDLPIFESTRFGEDTED